MAEFEFNPEGEQDPKDFRTLNQQNLAAQAPNPAEAERVKLYHTAFASNAPKQDPSTWDYIKDLGLSPVRGVYNAARDAYTLVDHIGNDFLPDWDKWEANTGAGAIASDVFQLIAGVYTGGQILKGVGIAGKLAKLGTFGKLAEWGLEGASAGIFFENKSNLSNLAKDHHIGGPITDFLAVGPTDSDATARLKMALEGVGLSPVTVPLARILGFFGKQALRSVTPSALKETAQEIGGFIKQAKSSFKFAKNQGDLAGRNAEVSKLWEGIDQLADDVSTDLATTRNTAIEPVLPFEAPQVDIVLKGTGLNSQELRQEVFGYSGEAKPGESLPALTGELNADVSAVKAQKESVPGIVSGFDFKGPGTGGHDIPVGTGEGVESYKDWISRHSASWYEKSKGDFTKSGGSDVALGTSESKESYKDWVSKHSESWYNKTQGNFTKPGGHDIPVGTGEPGAFFKTKAEALDYLNGIQPIGPTDAHLYKHQNWLFKEAQTPIDRLRFYIAEKMPKLLEATSPEAAIAIGRSYETLYHEAITATLKAGESIDEHLASTWNNLSDAMGWTVGEKATLLMRIGSQSGGDIAKAAAKIMSANDLVTNTARNLRFTHEQIDDFLKLAGKDPVKFKEVAQQLEAASNILDHATGLTSHADQNVVAKTIPARTQEQILSDASALNESMKDKNPILPRDANATMQVIEPGKPGVAPPAISGKDIALPDKPNKFGVIIPTLPGKPKSSKALTPEQEKNTDFNFGANVKPNPEAGAAYIPSFQDLFGAAKKVGELASEKLATTKQWIRERGGAKRIADILTFTAEDISKHGLKGMQNLQKAKHWLVKSILEPAIEWRANSLLYQTVLQQANLANNVLQSIYVPFERMVGGVGGYAISPITGGAAARSRAVQSFMHGARTIGSNVMGFLHTIDLLGFGAAQGPNIGATARTAMADTMRTGHSTFFGPKDPTKLEYGPAIKWENVAAIPGVAWLASKAPGPVVQGVAKAIDYTGAISRLSGRAVGAVDAAVKVINYNSHAQAALMQQVINEGVPKELQGLEVATRMQKLLKNGQVINSDRVIDEALQKAADDLPALGGDPAAFYGNPTAAAEYATEYADKAGYNDADVALSDYATEKAREVTFTSQTGPVINQVKRAMAHPVGMSLITPFVPFISTRSNIFKFAWERSGDLVRGAVEGASALWKSRVSSVGQGVAQSGLKLNQNNYSRLIRDLVDDNPLRKHEALGRVIMGAGIITTAMVLSQNSSNPDADVAILGSAWQESANAKLAQNTGAMPNSIQIGKAGQPGTIYIPYNRLDSIGILFGVIADYKQWSQFAKEDDKKHIDAISGGLWSSVSNNLVNNTWASTIFKLTSAIVQKDVPQIQRILGRTAGGMLPSFLSTDVEPLSADFQNTMKETETFTDQLRARLPGNSLMPQRDALGQVMTKVPPAFTEAFGKAAQFMSPMQMQVDKGDIVRNEMVRLNDDWPSIPHSISTSDGVKQIDLDSYKNSKGQTAHDRWGELVGLVKTGKNQNVYDVLKEKIQSPEYKALPAFDNVDHLDDPRIGVVGQILSAAQHKAKLQMLSEFPEIKQLVGFVREQRNLTYKEIKKLKP